MKVYLVWRTSPNGWSYEKSLIGIFKKKENAEILAKKNTHHGDSNDFTDCDITTNVEEWEVK